MSSHVLHWLPTLFFSCGFLPPSSHYRPALPFKLLVNNAISPFNHSTRFTAPYFRSTCSATSESHHPTRITALHCAQTAQQLRDFTFQLALLPCITLQVVLQHWNFTTNLALPPRITTRISAQVAQQLRSLTFQLALLPCIVLNLLNNIGI